MPRARQSALIQTRPNCGHEQLTSSEADAESPSPAPVPGAHVKGASHEERTVRQLERPAKEDRYTAWRAFAEVVTGFQRAGRHGYALTALFAILASIILVAVVASGAAPRLHLASWL